MSDIIYGKLKWENIDQIIELRKKQLKEEGAKETIDLAEPLRDYYKRHLREGTFVSWVAMDNDTVIATSGISIVEKPPYYSNPTGRIGLLSSMYTLEPYRRKGIAKKLLGLVINEAKEQGCGIIHITASDMGASLYRDFGFEKNNSFFQYKFYETSV